MIVHLSEQQFQGLVKEIKETFAIICVIELQESDRDTASWNEQKQCYEVEYRRRLKDYFIIHEVGHIFLAEITKNHKLIPILATREIIFEYCNSILDCFVDHRAFHHYEEYYPFFLNYIDEILTKKMDFMESILFIISNDLHHFLSYYIQFYLTFHYVLKSEDHQARQLKIKSFLRKCERIIRQKSDLTHDDIADLKQKLDSFDQIKSTRDSNVIFHFIFKILLELSLWDEEEIRAHMQLYFDFTVNNVKLT
ncbi:MAG: hypothetical protein HWN66_02955 [Candidatus Helarchaeota archaeon]|nr:hypothetical protein [Candidatus Helarchaeota archaeon]